MPLLPVAPKRIDVALTLPGAGTKIAYLCGIVRGLRKLPLNFPLVGGISAGGVRALPMVFGVSDDEVDDRITYLLQRNRMVDVGPLEFVDGRLGVCGWHVIPRVVEEMIGKGKTLGDAKSGIVIPVAELRTNGGSRVVYLSKRDTPHVLAAEAARATAAVPGTSTVEIPSFAPGGGLYTDPGVKDNTADAVFDDAPIPRLAIRLRSTDHGEPIRAGNVIEQAAAIASLSLSSANRIKSTRRDGVVIDVPTSGNGFDFSLSVDEIKRRMKDAEDFIDSVSDDIMLRLGQARSPE